MPMRTTHRRGAAAYTLENHKNGKYTLTVSVSDAWMNEEVRAYPVTVDPAIVTATSVVEDTYISSDAPTTKYSTATSLKISSKETAYVKFKTLPTLPAYSYTIRATVSVSFDTSNANQYVALYKVISSWNAAGLTYNLNNASSPSGKLDAEMVDYLRTDGYERTGWDITELYLYWRSNRTKNYGFALKGVPGKQVNMSICSAECGESTTPCLTVEYRDMKGLEDYMTVISQSVGDSATSGVNLATGEHVLVFPTLSTTDSLLPYTPSLVYNSTIADYGYTSSSAQTANTSNYTGYGFKLSICETVLKKNNC